MPTSRITWTAYGLRPCGYANETCLVIRTVRSQFSHDRGAHNMTETPIMQINVPIQS